jgi:predicted nucleic acid-binding protein
MKNFLSTVSTQHNLCLCSYTLVELVDVLKRKFPKQISDVENFLLSLSYSFIHTPPEEAIPKILGDITIRDKNDQPILASAISADVDILITGDKDFHCLEIERPEIMTVSEFIEKWM